MEKLSVGVKKIADVVGATMGTSGSNSLIQCLERPGSFVTNDGFTIAEAIKLADPIEEMGANILRQAISRANRASGDGSSTTAVLTAAILEEGAKYKDSPMDIKRSLESCIPLIEASLKAQKKDITVDTVGQVASISAEDEDIGNRIQEIYQKIGKDGIINWDISKTPEDSYTIGRGITISDATYITPYMCDPGSAEARMKDCPVLLCRDKITSALEFESLFKEMFDKGHRQLVIFTEEIDPPVVFDLLQTQRIRGFRTVVIKMPVLWRDEWWEDLELASGGKLVTKAAGAPLQKATMGWLGAFQNITVKREETIIEGTQDLTKHILGLKVEGDDKSLIRAARLNTMTARYFVGAHSETALAYRRLKVEDAINSASCALENGIVVGGGLALANATLNLPSATVGGKILKEALTSPIHHIANNAGKDNITLLSTPTTVGFNSKTGAFEDLIRVGIVDPFDVVLGAVKSAIGVAASVLTTKSVILLNKDVPIQV